MYQITYKCSDECQNVHRHTSLSALEFPPRTVLAAMSIKKTGGRQKEQGGHIPSGAMSSRMGIVVVVVWESMNLTSTVCWSTTTTNADSASRWLFQVPFHTLDFDFNVSQDLRKLFHHLHIGAHCLGIANSNHIISSIYQ